VLAVSILLEVGEESKCRRSTVDTARGSDVWGFGQMMTLRQIEVIRAVMVTGTIGGAAKLLNVSAPGISRLVKYTEKSLGIRFFQRQNGRYFPTPEAQNIFEQINGVYKKVDDLTEIISKIGHGALSELRVGSVPSISQVMVPRAIERVRRRYPDLRMDINVLKIEEAIDYLLLGRGDCVAMSYRLDHSGLDFLPLASGELFCIVPEGHELAARKQISAADRDRPEVSCSCLHETPRSHCSTDSESISISARSSRSPLTA
jgi:DNA-binding transcriptional LysR family regulator